MKVTKIIRITSILFTFLMIEGNALSVEIDKIVIEQVANVKRKNLTVKFNKEDTYKRILKVLSVEFQRKHRIPLNFTDGRAEIVPRQNHRCFKFTSKKDHDAICLNYFYSTWMSNEYSVFGKPANAFGFFIVELTSHGSKTDLTVRLVDYKIQTELKCCGAHGEYYETEFVESLGVEENFILDYIGKYIKK